MTYQIFGLDCYYSVLEIPGAFIIHPAVEILVSGGTLDLAEQTASVTNLSFL